MSAIQQLLAAYKSGGGDPNFSAVSLLLHMDGSNGSTTFTDSSSSPKTVTRTGATISTTQSKFGGASARFQNTTDKLTIPSSSAFDFGSGDFTVEAWFRPDSVSSGTQVLLDRGGLSSYTPWAVSLFNNFLRLECSVDGVSWAVNVFSDVTVSATTWYHLAATRSGSNFRLFLNGTLTASATASGALMSSSSTVVIGNTNSSASPFAGYMDDVRVTKGIARYTSNFSIPTEAFPNS